MIRSLNIDQALYPIYRTPHPNDVIQLYTGSLEVEQNRVTVGTTGLIELVWLRSPAVKFSFKENNPDLTSKLINFVDGPISLRLPVSTESINAYLLNHRGISDSKGLRMDFSGNVQGPICIGCGESVSRVLLHLPNFFDTLGAPVGRRDKKTSWLGRFSLTTDEWRITVDKVDNHQDLFPFLKASGGYAITHMMKIERVDDKEFDVRKIESLVEDLFYFFSFSRGSWTSPVLEVGFDKKGNRVWERWTKPRTDTWRSLASWFDPQVPERLTYFWPQFHRRLNDMTWGETLKRAIRWYIAANLKAGDLEGAIILAQTGYELLSWTRFVAEKGLSSEGFDKLPASDRLRLLLLDAGIPPSVPSSLRAIIPRCQSEKWTDGPHAVTQLRNRLVHPSSRNLQRLLDLSNDELQDAHMLSMWYLELALLYLLGFKDAYANRLIYLRSLGQVEPVPWQDR